MNVALQTNNLTKRYHRFQALDGLTMHVPEGSIYGLIGRNGAGKTTLIRLICGLQEPSSGSFELYGMRNDSNGIVNVRRRIGAIIEAPALYENMTAEQNLRQQYLILGLPSNGKLVQPEYEDGAMNPNYVGGMRRTVYGILHDLNPCGQVAQLSTWEVWHPIRITLSNLAMVSVASVLGCMLFERKDIK